MSNDLCISGRGYSPRDPAFPAVFALACSAGRRLACRRVMRSLLRAAGVFSATVWLIFFGSCDQHRLGEMPEVQKEHADPARGGKDAPVPAAKGSTEATATPAEFFPEKEKKSP